MIVSSPRTLPSDVCVSPVFEFSAPIWTLSLLSCLITSACPFAAFALSGLVTHPSVKPITVLRTTATTMVVSSCFVIRETSLCWTRRRMLTPFAGCQIRPASTNGKAEDRRARASCDAHQAGGGRLDRAARVVTYRGAGAPRTRRHTLRRRRLG